MVPTARLRLVWHGHVLSFKNRKRAVSRGILLTHPTAKRQMRAMTDAFRAQLASRSTSRTDGSAT